VQRIRRLRATTISHSWGLLVIFYAMCAVGKLKVRKSISVHCFDDSSEQSLLLTNPTNEQLTNPKLLDQLSPPTPAIPHLQPFKKSTHNRGGFLWIFTVIGLKSGTCICAPQSHVGRWGRSISEWPTASTQLFESHPLIREEGWNKCCMGDYHYFEHLWLIISAN
jgi:hypothetical protein